MEARTWTPQSTENEYEPLPPIQEYFLGNLYTKKRSIGLSHVSKYCSAALQGRDQAPDCALFLMKLKNANNEGN